MEPLFYTRRTMTPKFARELFRHVFVQYHIIHALLFIGYVGIFIYVRNLFPTNVVAFIVLIAIVIMYIYRPYSYAKKRIKEYHALYNADEDDEAIFFQDYFIAKDLNNKSEIKIEYKNITKMRSTKNLYIFHIRNSKTRIITDKNIIPKSNEVDFEKFINQKIADC